MLYNRDNREYLVKSFPMTVRYAADRVYPELLLPDAFLPLGPHRTGAAPRPPTYSGGSAPCPSTMRRTRSAISTPRIATTPSPEPGKDLVLLDTRQTEGGGDWSGQFVGTSFIFSHDAVLTTLEGDPRFFFDDSHTPQAQGTGTEEWGGGGDYWGGQNMTLPFAGHPVGAQSAEGCRQRGGQSRVGVPFPARRPDAVRQERRIRLEHGGTNESTEHYETVTYWYGLPAASLVQTDELKVGDTASERSHRYSSPEAGAPYEITSRYEWGPDTLNDKEIYPAETDRGRTTKTASEFTLQDRPEESRRDAAAQARLLLPQPAGGGLRGRRQGVEAGRRLVPGGFEHLRLFQPAGELGAAQHVVQTSNRRFRDDEFLLPRN